MQKGEVLYGLISDRLRPDASDRAQGTFGSERGLEARA